MSRKIAVLFPGIGYNFDRPLLYYTGKLAASHDYEIRRVDYERLPQKIRGDKAKMEQAFYMALDQTREQLKSVIWSDYDDILLISKSIGTIVAGAYAREMKLRCKHIVFTPLKQTFQFVDSEAIIFHGGKDPWAPSREILAAVKEYKLPLYYHENANHSLETGDVLQDVAILKKTMERVENYINAPYTHSSSHSVVIRQCTKHDQMAVTNMYNEVCWELEHTVNYPKWKSNEYPGYETVRIAIDHEELYGCFLGDECVGAFILNRDRKGMYRKDIEWPEDLSEYEYLTLHTLAVLPSHVRQGLAQQMVRFCEDYARDQGLRAIRLDVVPENKPARRLYEKLGYTYAGDYDIGMGIDEIPAFSLYEKKWEKRF